MKSGREKKKGEEKSGREGQYKENSMKSERDRKGSGRKVE